VTLFIFNNIRTSWSNSWSKKLPSF